MSCGTPLPRAPWEPVYHNPRCPSHDDYDGPRLACADDHYWRESDFVVASQLPSCFRSMPPTCPVWLPGVREGDRPERCGQPLRELDCTCDELTRAAREDAAEHAWEESNQ